MFTIFRYQIFYIYYIIVHSSELEKMSPMIHQIKEAMGKVVKNQECKWTSNPSYSDTTNV